MPTRRTLAPWLLVATGMAMDALFLLPVYLLYYSTKGADFGAFLALQGISQVCSGVLDLPTGILADRWDRRGQIVASSVAWLCAMVTLYFVTSYDGLMVVEVLASFALCMRSGTAQAYLHEALIAQGREASTARWQTRSFAASSASQVAAGAIGGWLYSRYADGPVMATIALATLALVLSSILPHVDRPHPTHANAWAHMGAVMQRARANHALLALLFVAPLVFASSFIVFWAIQNRLNALGLDATTMGLLMSAYFAACATSALVATKVLSVLGPRGVSLLLPFLMVGGCAAMLATDSAAIVWASGVIASAVVFALGKPLTTDLICHHAGNGDRATLLSVATLVERLLGGGMLFVVSGIERRTGPEGILLACMACGALLWAFAWRWVGKPETPAGTP